MNSTNEIVEEVKEHSLALMVMVAKYYQAEYEEKQAEIKRQEERMRTSRLTDKQVEQEIERLKKSPLVALARKESKIRNRRRKYLYCLRQFEKNGKALAESGVTMEQLNKLDEECNLEGLQ